MAPSSTQPLLDLQNLTKHYAKTRGVGPLTLQLAPGIHGLLGPNGSGKTTLLKTLLGFLAPTQGSGRVLGRDIVREPLAVRRLVGYMPENDVIVPGLNATQTVRLAAELCGIPAERAHEAAAEALFAVGLGDERFHAPQRLSTGQRQKVKLAAALVHAPRLLFLDEPTNGLDPKGRRTMLRLIEEVSREKDISVILSTHILPDVEAVCDSAVVLSEGLLRAVEPVRARAMKDAIVPWHRVQTLGDPKPFLAACRGAKYDVRQVRGAHEVACKDASKLLDLARRSGTVLVQVVPATTGVEDAVLDRLEAVA